ncbi:MAG TPA: restriction endonuclease, partial [bacterium]|nr:restriction endonuclease [bacterium]
KKDRVNLVKELIRLKKKGFKFPIEHPYISFLSHYEDAVDKNPETIKKICDKLFEMDYEELKEKLEAPKRASRRIGPMFRKWLKNKFKFLNSGEFRESTDIVFLEGGDNVLKDYAKDELRCKFSELSKGLDFVAKINDKYIIGTAKFITDFGGSQDNQFMEAIRLVKETKCQSNVIKVAVIDGVAYLGGKMKATLQKLKSDEFCFSALLLDEFIEKQKIK